MTYSDIIANRILSLCKDRGITINKLATLSGITQSTMSDIVNKRTTNPKLRTLHRIAQGFGMTLSAFLDFPEMNEMMLFDE